MNCSGQLFGMYTSFLVKNTFKVQFWRFYGLNPTFDANLTQCRRTVCDSCWVETGP